ncbi:MAG: hypothetical protein ACTTIS_03950 [Streptobacillus sp.]
MEMISYFFISFIILLSYSLLLSWNSKKNLKNEKLNINNTIINVLNEGYFIKTEETFDFKDIEEIKVLEMNIGIKNNVRILDSLELMIRYRGNRTYYEHIGIFKVENSLMFIKNLKEKLPEMYLTFITESVFIIPSMLKILETSMENI